MSHTGSPDHHGPPTVSARTRRIALIGLVASAAAILSPASAARAGDAFVLGSGDAQARVVRVGPSAGKLSFAVELGQSLADYVGTVGHGQSRTIDLATIGLVLAAKHCDGDPATLPRDRQPPTLRVDSRDDGSADGESLSYPPTPAGASFGHQFAAADGDPTGRARTRLAAIGAGSPVELVGGESTATTGVRDGTRFATATVDIPAIVLGGTVRIVGMHWEATQVTGEGGEVEDTTGRFTVDHIEIGEQTIDVGEEVGAAADALKALAPVLDPIGLDLVLPEITDDRGVARVSPLQINVDNSPLGRTLVAPVLEAGRPVRQQATDFLIAYDCNNGTYVTILDIYTGVAAGSGLHELEFGGVSAFTEGTEFDNPFGAIPPLPDLGSLPPVAPGVPVTPAVLGDAQRPATDRKPATAPAGEDVALPPLENVARSIPDGRAATIVTIVLLAAAALAWSLTADRVAARRARFVIAEHS